MKIRKYILYFLYWPFAGFATDFTLEPLDGGSVDDRTDKSSENFKEKTAIFNEHHVYLIS